MLSGAGRWLRRWGRLLAVVGVLAAAALASVWWVPGWNTAVRDAVEAVSWVVTVATAAAMLLAWSTRPRAQHPSPPAEGGTTNIISGPVSGQVVQLRDVTGNVHLGDPAPTRTRVGLAGRALHLVDGRLPEVREVDLLSMRVKPALDTHRPDGSDLPPYVGRDLDPALEQVLRRGGMVLLHGRAAVGKTRTAAEALHRVCPHHRLLTPRDGAALRELVEAGIEPPGPLVVWLDDLERYLSPGGLDLALLQRLCPPEDPGVVVVATMRDGELAARTHAGERAATGVDRGSHDLLTHLHGPRRVHVAPTLTPAERERARRIATRDPRVHRALTADEGFVEHLAAGPAKVDRRPIDGDPLSQGE